MLITGLLSLAAFVAPVFSLAVSEPSGALIANKRQLQSVAAARIALAKARAAKRSSEIAGNLVERDLDSSNLDKRQLPRERCSIRQNGSKKAANAACVDFYLSKGVTYSKNAKAACYDTSGDGLPDLCQIRCPAGYLTAGTEYSIQCVKSANTCKLADGTREVCPSPNNGFSSCLSNGGGCSFQCYGRGYFKNPRNPSECINTGIDPSNCGAPGHRCPRAYLNNRNYAPACVRSQCTLSCPRGWSAYTVSGSTLMSCAPN